MTAKQESNLLIMSMIADRTGWHEDLLQSIITITISGRKKKHLEQVSPKETMCKVKTSSM